MLTIFKLGGTLVYRTLAVLGASATPILLAGCSLGGTQGSVSPIPGAAPIPGTQLRTALLSAPLSRAVKIPGTLYVSNTESATATAVEIYKNGTYEHVGTITKGVASGAEGLWVDKAGNLYVANSRASNVTEYKPRDKSPICRYSKQLVSPIDETTDSAGNLYVVDFNHFKSPGYIYKYKQCSNAVAARYSVVTPPEGVAVDAEGDIFVSYVTVAGGAFEEFKSGQTTPTELSAKITSAGGLVIDGKGNLIADDQAGRIDVIHPPYTKATTLVSGLTNPYRLALNASQNLLFNVDTAAQTVAVYKYPSGKLVTTLGSAYGITNPAGVSDSPNAVF